MDNEQALHQLANLCIHFQCISGISKLDSLMAALAENMATVCRLRRIGPNSEDTQNPQLRFINLDEPSVKFGRNPDQVQVILHSKFYSNMISREHAEIRKNVQNGQVEYFLIDRSLNGTYINENRAPKEPVKLNQSDIIKFGHINGAAIPAGQHAPQPSAEFTYMFETLPRSAATSTSSSVSNLAAQWSSAAQYQQSNQLAQQLVSVQQQQRSTQQYQTNSVAAQAAAAMAGRPQFWNAYAAQQAQQAANPFNPYTQLAATSFNSYAAFCQQYRNQSPVTSTASDAASLLMQQQRYLSQLNQSCSLNPAQPTPQIMQQAAALAAQHAQQQQLQSTPSTSNSLITSISLINSQCATSVANIEQRTGVALDSVPPLPNATTSSLAPTSSQAAVIITAPSTKRAECDSSMPSPPQNDTISNDLRMLAAQASERVAFNTNSPNDFLDKVDQTNSIEPETGPAKDENIDCKEHKPTESRSPSRIKSPPSRRQSTDKSKKRKTNELDRLLTDLTTGIFTTEKRKQSNASSEGEKKLSPNKKIERSRSNRRSSKSATASRSSSNESDRERRSVKRSSTEEREKEKSAPLKKRKGFRSPPPDSGDDKPKPSREQPDKAAKKVAAAKFRAKQKMNASRRKQKSSSNEDNVLEELLDNMPVAIEDTSKFHDSEQRCDAKEKCKKPQDYNVKWVGCDSCDGWYHQKCAIPKVTDMQLDDDDFQYECSRCKPESPPESPTYKKKAKKNEKSKGKKTPAKRQKLSKSDASDSDSDSDDYSDDDLIEKPLRSAKGGKIGKKKTALASVGKRHR